MPNNSTHVALLFYSGVTQTSVNDYVDYINLMIEKGSVATSYSPYFTTIELCKIGSYKDEIRKSKGKIYLIKIMLMNYLLI